MFATGSYYEIQNAIENRHGLPSTYSSAVTGYGNLGTVLDDPLLSKIIL